MLRPDELFVITCFDKVFKTNLKTKTIKMLKSSGFQSGAFSICHRFAIEECIYIIGGRDTKNDERLSRILKYKVLNDIWSESEELNVKRDSPGCLISQDQSKLYIYGGKTNTLEIKNFDIENEKI